MRHALRFALASSRFLGAFLAAVVALAAPVLAQQPDSATRQSAPTTPADSGAAVVVGTDTVFRLYGGLGPFSAATRAAAATERIRQHVSARSATASVDSVTIVDREGRSEVVAGGEVLFTVVDADAVVMGEPRRQLAARYATATADAMRRVGESMSMRSLTISAVEAFAATAALVLVFWLLAWLARRAHTRIDALHTMRVPAVRIQQLELLSAGRLAALLSRVVTVLRVVLTLLALYVYVPLVLSVFPWTAALSHRIVGYALQPFKAALAGFVNYLPNLFYLAAGVVIARYLLAFLHLIFDAVGSGAIKVRGFYADWAEPTYKIVRVLVLAFVGMALYPFLPGASSDAFKGVSIFLGVLVSFGSSAAVGNMIAGIVLTYTRAFQIGDRIQIGETIGDVTEKTLLVTRLRTIKNVAVTVPNGTVLNNQVVNYTTLSASKGLILHTSVTIGYDTSWRRVHELLVAAARQTEHVLATPVPFVLQTALNDFYVAYELNAYSDRADLMAQTYSQLHANIQDAFAAGGVEIMSPHYGALRDGNRVTIPTEAPPAAGGGQATRAATESTDDRSTDARSSDDGSQDRQQTD